jgi:hypothetical protein
MEMSYPTAEGFRTGKIKKPVYKKEEFYKGGFHEMGKRVKNSLKAFPGAYDEFLLRSEGMEYSDIVGLMWEYITLE